MNNSRRRVLLLCPSQTDLLLYRYLLATKGLEVEEFKEGRRALERLDNSRESFHGVMITTRGSLVDGMEAGDVCRWIRQRYPMPPPVIMLTSVAPPHVRDRLLTTGVDLLIEKPFDPYEMLAEIDALLSGLPPRGELSFTAPGPGGPITGSNGTTANR